MDRVATAPKQRRDSQRSHQPQLQLPGNPLLQQGDSRPPSPARAWGTGSRTSKPPCWDAHSFAWRAGRAVTSGVALGEARRAHCDVARPSESRPVRVAFRSGAHAAQTHGPPLPHTRRTPSRRPQRGDVTRGRQPLLRRDPRGDRERTGRWTRARAARGHGCRSPSPGTVGSGSRARRAARAHRGRKLGSLRAGPLWPPAPRKVRLLGGRALWGRTLDETGRRGGAGQGCLHTDSRKGRCQRPAVAGVCGDRPRPSPVAGGTSSRFSQSPLCSSQSPFRDQHRGPPPPAWGTCLRGWARAADAGPSEGRHPPAAAVGCPGPDASEGCGRGRPLLSTP